MGNRMCVVLSGEADVDREELDTLTRQLRQRLLELDVDDVRPEAAGEPAPEGAKPGEVVTVGALVVTLAPAVLRPALRLLETWLTSRPVRTVRVEVDGHVLELGHASEEQQQLLTEAYLEKLRADSGESAQ
ncbi:hypothetical protein ACYF6T_17025 [Streptomyces sp. 7R007]